MFAVMLVVAAFAIAAALAGPLGLASHLVRPTVLLWLIVGNALFLLFRLFAAWDAFRGAGGRLLAPALLAVFLVIAVPHVAAGYYQIEVYGVLTHLFGGNAAPTPDPVAAKSPATTFSTTTSSTTTVPPPPLVTSSSIDDFPIIGEPTTTVGAFSGQERLNLLLLGGDAGPGRGGLRTDTMIVASIGIENGDLAMFGFPRNFNGLIFPDGTPFIESRGLLNAVYAYGIRNPELFPGNHPGPAATTTMIEVLSGLQIDYFVLVDMGGFVNVVDAVGGVEIDVRRPIDHELSPPRSGDTWRHYRIDPGLQRLDGLEALAYVRSRTGTNDYDRMARQRCLLAAVAGQLDTFTILRSFPDLVPVIENNVVTDIPLDALPDLIELIARVDIAEALTVGFTPPEWIAGRTPSGHPIPDIVKIRAAVQQAISGSFEGLTTRGVVSEAC